MESIRQKIINEIISAMQGILIANGYQTDLGNNVDDWRIDWDKQELPALSVCDLTEYEELVGDEPTATRQINTLTVQLRIFTSSLERAKDLRKMRADVQKAIGPDQRWNNLAVWTKPKENSMVLPQDAFELAGKAIEIEIAYMTNAFNAYE